MRNPEVSHNNLPAAGDISAAYQEVLAYNQKHASVGAVLIQSIAVLAAQEREVLGREGMIPEKEPAVNDREQDASRKIDSLNAEGEMFGELQLLIHRELFEHIGLQLVFQPDRHSFSAIARYSGKHQQSENLELSAAQKVVPTVYSSELLADFLQDLSSETANHDADLLDLLTDVLGNLRWAATIGHSVSLPDVNAEQARLIAEFSDDHLRHFVTIDPVLQALDLRRPAFYRDQLAFKGRPGSLGKHRHRAIEYLRNYSELEDYVIYRGRGLLKERLLVGSTEDLRNSRNFQVYFDNLSHRLVEKVDLIVDLKTNGHTRQYGRESAEAIIFGMRKVLGEMHAEPDAWYATESNRRLLAVNIHKLLTAYDLA